MTNVASGENHNSFGSFSATGLALGRVFEGGTALAERVFGSASPVDLLRAASEHFGDQLVLTTAFGLEGSVLVDMIGRHRLPIRIVTLDTGLFFRETLRTWRRLEERYDLRIEGMSPALSLEAQTERHGDRLWEREPDLCCDLRKLEPLRRILSGSQAWITGVRREQTPERASTPKVGEDDRFQVTKLAPLADWPLARVRHYLKHHEVPYNPMFDDGYPSVGCRPCTTKVAPGEDLRAGRWRGHEKRECGLHWNRQAPLQARKLP
ncbi:MAG: phosphoadenylyl-sulfate reductase [Myxococcota bacterium]